MTASVRRVALMTLLVLALVGGGVADRLIARSAPVSARAAATGSLPAVAPSGAESSAWYCTGGTGAQGGAPATVVLTNFSTHAVKATLSTVAELTSSAAAPSGAEATPAQRLVVPAGGQLDVPSSQLGHAGALAVAVVADGGGVAVSETVSSPLGWSAAPCASSTAPQWYFAHGATTQGGGLVLSLFNPASSDASVDISLVTSSAGALSPAAYQGVDVPAHSLVTENVGDHIAQDPAVATVVTSLSGTVVATELQSIAKPGAGGIALTLGAPSASAQWSFPQNTDVTGGSVVFHVLNPSAHSATVSVAIGLPKGAAAEPLSMSVPAQAVATLVAQNETRIPANTPYAATFTSTGVPVVVAREVTSPSGAPASEPSDGVVPGVPEPSVRWFVPAPAAPGTGAWALAVVDLGRRSARVEVVDGDGRAIAGKGAAVVEPGTPLFVGPNPGPPFGTSPFQVRSDRPVVIELDGVPVASPGVVVVPAFASS